MELQPSSQEIYGKKYQLRMQDGTLIDTCLDDTFKRVARGLSELEEKATMIMVDGPNIQKQTYWNDEFLWALRNGAIPAGRIIANTGAGEYKSRTSTINCLVSDNVRDSIESIGLGVHEAMTSLSTGAGMGFCFSLLRPKGAYVNGVGASTSGPLSFADIYDSMCKTISSAGGRRGAMMLTFHVHHPDIIEVIKAKREDGRLRQFNISALISDEFMEAVKSDGDWDLYFPISQSEYDMNLAGDFTGHIVEKEWPVHEDNYVIENGLVACKVYKTIKARELWELIMRSTFDFSEPGFLLIDKINRENNNYYCEVIISTNPCGEQPLPANGACLLGSVNLTMFVNNPFGYKNTKDRKQTNWNPKFDWDKFRKVVRIFTRMLDNVVGIHGLPLEKQAAELIRKRRHGMGFTGLSSALTMLKIKYGSESAVKFTEEVTKVLAIEGYKAGIELAKEKGMAPIFTENDNNLEMFIKSEYMQKLPQELLDDIQEHGCRFTHHSSIAPTGTISLSICNNVSNGIEPSFLHIYNRNIIEEGKSTKKQVEVYSYEFLKYKELVDPDATVDSLPDYFVTADSVSPKQHIDMQAAAQKWIDSSISKTINCPKDITFDEFKDLYMYAYESGCKGVTTYRPSDNIGTVLVNPEDQKNKQYTFELDSGEVIIVPGDEDIEYNGETHKASLLYEAIKEGQYGKF